MFKCPLIKEDCLEGECAWWVVLKSDGKEQGRCAIAWSAILLVELRYATERGKKDEQ